MSAPRGLHTLARLHGIQTAYYDTEGRRVGASPDALMATLRALGVELDDAAGIPRQLEHRRRVLRDRALEPVCVVWIPDGESEAAGACRLRTPARLTDRPVQVRIRLEDGTERTASPAPEALEVTDHTGHGWDANVEREVPLPTVPTGYHTLVVEVGSGPALRRNEALLIASPARARGWDALPGRSAEVVGSGGGRGRGGARGRGGSRARGGAGSAGTRPWGLFAPLYGLRERDRPGPASYETLARFAGRAGEAGASVVGTLPLLATFLDRPYDPSPYAPVSRLFWNEAYVGGQGSSIERRVSSIEGQASSGAFFDVRAVMADRRRALEGEARAIWGRMGEGDGVEESREAPGRPSSGGVGLGTPPELRWFLERTPGAEDYARFRAITEARGPWPEWPARLRARDIRPGDYDLDVARYHLYAQWRAERELKAAAEAAAERGVGLYLDLPVGVHPAGYDTWRERALFAPGATAGAPPDPLAATGQDWGFPPPDPERSRLAGHRYFIAAIRSHLRFASVLRVDHVMQLHRLYWIATGDGRDGVYVRYPAEELYAILCLESHRAGAVIVGEDLGTVPRRVRRGMRKHGVPGMYVAQFELGQTTNNKQQQTTTNSEQPVELGGAALGLRPVPAGVVGSIGTHDTPTFAGWWWGEDIRGRLGRGEIGEADAEAALVDRARMRERLARGLEIERRRDSSPEYDYEYDYEVLAELLRRLGASRAGLVLATVEDLWLERAPQNVPGTASEGNWRRRLARPLEALAEPDVRKLLDVLDEARTESREEPREEGP